MAFVKLCCIDTPDALEAALAARPDAVGFVGRHLSGPEVIEDDAVIASYAARVPDDIVSVLLLRDTDLDVIVKRAQITGCRALQLVEPPSLDVCHALRARLPTTALWFVVHVDGQAAIARAQALAPVADQLILDSGSLQSGVFGGSGKVHDWQISAQIVACVPIPVLLAGGLRTDTLEDAWKRVAPAGFDVCSGIRTQGRLDASKAAAFVRQARSLPLQSVSGHLGNERTQR